MTVRRPPVDPRSYDDLVRQTEVLAERFTAGEWRPSGGRELGGALIRIMAGMAEQIIERLNGLPDRSFLAFLELIGTQARPPHPARVAVSFLPAAGTTEAFEIPEATQVAAPADGDRREIVFETDRRLVATPAQLLATYVREPARDLYAKRGGLADTDAPISFPAFRGDTPIPHVLYAACDSVLGLADLGYVHVELTTEQPDELIALPLHWSSWDGEGWQRLDATVIREPRSATYRIAAPPTLEPVAVSGLEHTWLRAELAAPLPPDDAGRSGVISRSGLAPDRLVAPGGVDVDPSAPYHPFGSKETPHTFEIEAAEPFSRLGATVEIGVELAHAGVASTDLELEWACPSGGGWKVLGRSSPEGSEAVGGSAFVDGTGALTRSGVVEFTAPPDLVSSRVVRVRVASGGYGLGEALDPPIVRDLTVSYRDWELPAVRSISVAYEATMPVAPPAWAFANRVEIDLTKEFQPFGERPAFNDTLYLESERFSAIGSDVTLDVTLESAGAPAGEPQLTWEMSTDTGWVGIVVSDETAAFTAEGKVSFRVPDSAGPTSVNGRTGSWIRARLTGGDYGRPGRTKTGDPVTIGGVLGESAEGKQVTTGGVEVRPYEWIPDTFVPPMIKGLSIATAAVSSRTGRPADACVVSNDFVDRVVVRDGRVLEREFTPFVATSDLRPCLYLGFDRAFGNRPVSLFVDVDAALSGNTILDAEQHLPDPARVTWEYAAEAGGWAQLSADDETAALSRRGMVSFLGPDDMTTRRLFGEERFWVRLKWESGQAAAEQSVRSTRLNTVWATEGTSIEGETLGSGTGNPSQSFTTAHRPVLTGEEVEVFEPRRPSGESDLVVAGGGAWVRWVSVVDFHGSGPGDRHYIIDHLDGVITFGDGRRGSAPPIGAAGNVRVSYRTGGGVDGNVAAGAITEHRSAIASLDSVINLEPASGGSAPESFEQVRERGPRVIRHRSRATTVQDYEDLAMEASPDVVRAAGVLARSRADAGRVGVVVVAGGTRHRPDPSLELLGRVERHLRERCDPTVDIWVAGPRWRSLSVAVEVVPISFEVADLVRRNVDAAITGYLHPLSGGIDGIGFPFDRMPHDSEFYRLIEGLPGVDYVRRLEVERASDATDSDPGARRPFLVSSGEHTVSVVGHMEGV